jgi:DNA modification methylase
LFFDRPARSEAHPTMKPVALLEALLRNSSRRGDIVFDPFAGSGSTLIACERLARRCFAIEIDPAYCDVVRRRYREYVGG